MVIVPDRYHVIMWSAGERESTTTWASLAVAKEIARENYFDTGQTVTVHDVRCDMVEVARFSKKER